MLGVIFIGISIIEGEAKTIERHPLDVWIFAGMAVVFTKFLVINIGHHWTNVAIFAVCCILTYIPAFVILQAALQQGMAVIVAPVYNGLMELVPIVIGMIALNERFPKSTVLTVIRILAFAMILVGTVILSQRAEEAEEEIETEVKTEKETEAEV